jgi:hypothetical protein
MVGLSPPIIAGGASPFQAYTRTLMAEKTAKPKGKAKREPRSVLGTLPASRPERIGRPRGGKAKAKPRPKPKAKAKPRAKAKPAAVSPGSPPLRVRRVTDAPPPEPLAAPTGTELVTTTVRAAGELAQIGFTLGGQALKRAVDRIRRIK